MLALSALPSLSLWGLVSSACLPSAPLAVLLLLAPSTSFHECECDLVCGQANRVPWVVGWSDGLRAVWLVAWAWVACWVSVLPCGDTSGWGSRT